MYLLSTYSLLTLYPTPALRPFSDQDLFLRVFGPRIRYTEPPKATGDEDGLLHLNGVTWLPLNANELKLKLFTVAFDGLLGHREEELTRSRLREYFT